MLVEVAWRGKAEVAKQKSNEVVFEKMAELEKFMDEEDANPKKGMEDIGRPTKGKKLGK